MQEAEIDAALGRIAASLEANGVPGADIAALIRHALDELLAIHGLAGQLAEVAREQRDQLAAISVQLATRDELHALLIQLRELMRKQVAGLYDLERAVGGGATAAERHRRQREEDA